MVNSLQKAKNVIKVLMVVLFFIPVQYELLGQTVNDKIHKTFLKMADTKDNIPIYSQVKTNKDWLKFLSDSSNIENGIRGGCRIKNLHEVFKNFDFHIEGESHYSNFNRWEKKKLPGVKLIEKLPQNGKHIEYSLPLISGEWGIIRKMYYENKELLEDSILIYQSGNKRDWHQVCQLYLLQSFPH